MGRKNLENREKNPLGEQAWVLVVEHQNWGYYKRISHERK